MTIVTSVRDGVTYLFCDGCGERVCVEGGWWDGLDALNELNWFTVPYDYGWDTGGYEHFCCVDCLDPEEWDND
jgi:hypothetical protein